MIIDRRTFIQISVPLVATAAAVTFLPSGIAGASSSQLAGGKQDQKHPTFKIHGWDRRDDSARNSSTISSAGSMTGDQNSDDIFISINQSWRTAWR